MNEILNAASTCHNYLCFYSKTFDFNIRFKLPPNRNTNYNFVECQGVQKASVRKAIYEHIKPRFLADACLATKLHVHFCSWVMNFFSHLKFWVWKNLCTYFQHHQHNDSNYVPLLNCNLLVISFMKNCIKKSYVNSKTSLRIHSRLIKFTKQSVSRNFCRKSKTIKLK